MQKFLLILLLVLIIFPSLALSQTPVTSQQIGLCGAESISSGEKGEIRLRNQTGGTDVDYDVCWPKSCSAGMTGSTVISDKYKSGSVDIFNYQKICMADVDSINLNECSSVISSENQKCSPTKCDAGFVDAGILTELRDKSGNFWTENVYRLCAKGSKIENATLVFKENYGNFSAAEQCPANFSDTGVFRQIHFSSSEYYRAWRICVKYGAQSTTSTALVGTTASTNLANASKTTLTSTAPPTTTQRTTTTYPTATPYSPTTTFSVPAPAIGKAPCSESDGGISIYSAGSVRLENGTLYIDTCIENNLINEYYCSEGNATVYVGNCTAGCLNSACRGAGEALAEKGALVATKIVDSVGYVIDLVASGKILERGVALVGKIIDTFSSALDVVNKLIGKGSQYVDTIEIANKTGNLTNITTSTT